MSVMAAALALLLLAVNVSATTRPKAEDEEISGPSLPEDPHISMNKEGTCLDCHKSYMGKPDPHEFVVDVSQDCMKEKCHFAMGDRMSRMHPLDKDMSTIDFEIPDATPLDNGRMSCGTCHQPHLEGLSRIRSAPWEEPSFYLEKIVGKKTIYIKYYRTYYLRISDPVNGYMGLCTSCHKGWGW